MRAANMSGVPQNALYSMSVLTQPYIITVKAAIQAYQRKDKGGNFLEMGVEYPPHTPRGWLPEHSNQLLWGLCIRVT